MPPIRKKIIKDQDDRPIAVQIDYEDWVRLEIALSSMPLAHGETDLARHIGRLNWPVDGVEYQKSVRGEWS